MDESKLWQGLGSVLIDINVNIKKLCSIDDNIYLLTNNLRLYHGTIDNTEPVPRLSIVKFHPKDIIDIACCTKSLYIIDFDGRVFKSDILMNEFTEICLEEEAKNCVHGFKSSSCAMRVRCLSVGEFGCLYITDNYELWASGNMPQIGIETDIPKRVLFFEGKVVNAAAVGIDFAMVLSRKSLKYDRESDSETSENVFISNCPQCSVMSRISSPISLDNTCPLGLPVSKSTEDTSSGTNVSIANEDTTSTDSEPHKYVAKIEADDTEVVTTEQNSDECSEEMLETNQENPSITSANGRTSRLYSEAARQFLTKQLSWVSAGEEYLADCTEKPTRIIKENVSNITSLVFEGVKSLSRHMSGSDNDALETNDLVIVNDTEDDVASKLYDFLGSCSTFSERENSEHDVTEKTQNLLKNGQNMLNSDLWAWGNVNHGQLGTGDNIKRSRPIVVSKLSNIGVKKIHCGNSHALALTLDGRAFLWGENSLHQISSDSKMDQSFPKQFTSISTTDRVRDVACGAAHSVILTHNLHIFFTGKHKTGITDTMTELLKHEDAKTEDTTERCFEMRLLTPSKMKEEHIGRKFVNQSNIFASGLYTYCNTIRRIEKFVSVEQNFLQELLLININLTKPFMKNISTVVSDVKIYEILCNRYADILYLTALNVETLQRYFEHSIAAYETIFMQKCDEILLVFNDYINAICDVISLSGFSTIAKSIDMPQAIASLYPCSKQKSSKNEPIITYFFLHPLNRISIYKNTIETLFEHTDAHDKKAMEKRKMEILSKWDSFNDEQSKRIREAEFTKTFWESATDNIVEKFRSPERRLIRDSRKHALWVQNAGRFTSHWFVLLSDMLLHVINGSINVYYLKTLWVEPLQDTDSLQNAISLTTPEDHMAVYTTSPAEKLQWLQGLQLAIKKALNKTNLHQPPVVRNATYSFSPKSVAFKEANYSGRWFAGKMHGTGKMQWPDGRTYLGQFSNGAMHGFGRMETPSIGTYEGQWRDGTHNGHGVYQHINGDIYTGQFKDGQRHGHGELKRGHFNSAGASVYVGEFVAGARCGYGVLDDIANGEKYCGMWNDRKNGCGLLVTLDTSYYEGVFLQDVITGHGVVVFEDGTHYEGELKGLLGPAGKGALTVGSRVLDGNLGGTWDNIRITGTLKTLESSQEKPSSFGKLSVQATQKWIPIYRQYHQQLGQPNATETQKIWQNVAVFISNARLENSMKTPGKKLECGLSCDDLDTIPTFGIDCLDAYVYNEIKTYLVKAFDSPTHPLCALLCCLANAFTFTYGGLIVSHLLCPHALGELRAMTQGLYEVTRAMFPALPKTKCWLDDGALVSPSTLLHPIILPQIHSALFVLYALAHKDRDDSYWRRLCAWNVMDSSELMNFLAIDSNVRGVVTSELFQKAIESLQQIKTTFCAHHKVQVLRTTFKILSDSVYEQLGANFLMGMDTLFPLFLVLVIRARILQLGSEIALIEDLLEQSGIIDAVFPPNGKPQSNIIANGPHENGVEHCQQQGEDEVMITTLKACYFQILQEKLYSNN